MKYTTSQADHKELIDGVTSINISGGHGTKESNSKDEPDNGVLLTPEYALKGRGEDEDSATIVDHQDATTVTTDVSKAECVIEPTLVMLEVRFKTLYMYYLPFIRYVDLFISIKSAKCRIKWKKLLTRRKLKCCISSKLSCCLCLQVYVPSSCTIDGVYSQHNYGTGIIIHHSSNLGLVAVDKNTVEISTSNVMLSFAAFPFETPGEVNF